MKRYLLKVKRDERKKKVIEYAAKEECARDD